VQGQRGRRGEEGGSEVLDVGHAVFEQIADPVAIAGVEQVPGVALLDVLAERDHRQPGAGRAQLDGVVTAKVHRI